MSRWYTRSVLRLPNTKLERHATWLEIFFDLIFAVIIMLLAERQLHHFNWLGILKNSALFIPIMWTWTSYTVFAARFDNNDVIHWLFTFIIMFAGIIMATQIPYALEERSLGFAFGFLLGQISILLLYLKVDFKNLIEKNIALFYISGFGLAGICWFISLFIDSSFKFILWILGMIIYLVIPWIGRRKILTKAPLDTTYIPERFGAFIIIILGQLIASVVLGLVIEVWNTYTVIKCIFAFIFAICIFIQYYYFTQTADYKCTLRTGQPYIYAHIPLIIALILLGDCMQIFLSGHTHSFENAVFLGAAILYLLSFKLLKLIAIPKFKIDKVMNSISLLTLLGLFFLVPENSFLLIMGLLFIFLMEILELFRHNSL